MRSSAEEALASRGLAVRELTTLPGFDHRAFVLVSRDFGTPSALITDPEIPVLAIAAGRDRGQACREFLEWCYQTASASEEPGAWFGVGRSDQEARDRAEARAREAHATALLEPHLSCYAPPPAASAAEELPDVDGQLTTTSSTAGGQCTTVLAELRLHRPPFYLASVGCGPQAPERAVLGVYTKLNAFQLRRRHSSAWVEAASSAPQVPAQDRAAQPPWEDVPSPDVIMSTWSDERGLKVASSRLRGAATEPPAGLLSGVDAASLRLRTPVHIALAHSTSDVQLSRYFHENSKLHAGHRSLPVIDRASITDTVHRTLAAATRDYRHARSHIALSPRAPRRQSSLSAVLSQRRSAAPFSTEPLDLGDLAYILLSAYGVTARVRTGVPRQRGGTEPATMGLRATPSAGGLHSNDIFVLIDQVPGVEPGLYYFHPEAASLQLVNSRARIAALAEATGYADRIQSSSVVLLLTGAFSRIQWKYWERGYRMVLLDCGHLAQSLIVAATELDVVAHPIGGFVDDEVNGLIGLDGVNDSALHLVVLGQRRT